MRAPLFIIACLVLSWCGPGHCQEAAALRDADPLEMELLASYPIAAKPSTELVLEPAAAIATASQAVPENSNLTSERFDSYQGSSAPVVFGNLDVGYDEGFIIASGANSDLDVRSRPFVLKLNGWGQLRHTNLDSRSNTTDLNQFELKRARLIFSGNAFEPEFRYFVQLDGRSTDGDTVTLLDYYLSYDVGRAAAGLAPGVFNARIGRYKMPFHMARWISGKEFEFTDRSVASTFFDVNRSLACGFFGACPNSRIPFDWEVAIFNGLVTGGAETGSSGILDDNFAFSGRLFTYLKGDWGESDIADLSWHEELAIRTGGGFAATTVAREGATEFQELRVVDSGLQLGSLLPAAVMEYDVSLFAVHMSTKYRGMSTTIEYYFRSTGDFEGSDIGRLDDHGFWLQLGQFIVPAQWQVLARWSRVVGNSGSLGLTDQSTEEIGLGLAHYFKRQNAKLVFDMNYLNGSPISSPTLDISPGDEGFLYRMQLQFSF